jgi:ribosomal protein S18 acetylase RimI-like enzyme
MNDALRSIPITTFTADDLTRHIDELSALLHDCVHAGAAIHFVLPHSHDDARAFWTEKVLPPLHAGKRILLVAMESGRAVGTVQLDIDTPPNQRHRAEVCKLLVHPDCRRRGIARRLMLAIDEQAALHGRSLITLDTRTGDKAEKLYASLGYITVGVLPGYSRDSVEDRLDAMTLMYKTQPQQRDVR